MRKRFNSFRGRRSAPDTGSYMNTPAGPSNNMSPMEEGMIDTASMNNPWREDFLRDVNGRGQDHHLSHRLSYDVASGVIMLPDDGDWLDEEGDSDEDVTSEVGITVTAPAESDDERGTEEGGMPSTRAVSNSPMRTSRYGTYFHRPERRKQVVPGEFPSR
jgi:hypothetical protein